MPTENLTEVYIGGESDGVTLRVNRLPNRQPKLAKKEQFYKFLFEHTVIDTKVFFYYFSGELGEFEAKTKADAWLDEHGL
jgi:hypothetical protein